MEFKAETLHSIRGTRYSYKAIQTVKRYPIMGGGEYKDEVCDIVVKYDAVEEDIPYLQFHSYSGTLSSGELNQIHEKLNAGFIEADFDKPHK